MSALTGRVVSGTALIGLLLSWTGATNGAWAANNNLVLWSWGGTLQKAQASSFFGPCAQKYGLTLVQDENPDNAKLKAAVDTKTVQWDIVDVGQADYAVLVKQGVLQPIDYAQFDKATLDALDPIFRPTYGMATTLYVQGIGFRTDLGKTDHPVTWVEFWDTKKFPGARAIPQGTFDDPPWEPALLGDGVAPDKLYPLDFERALKSLDRIKPEVKVWYSSAAQGVQALVNGDVDYAIVPNGRVQQAASQGAKVGFEFSQAVYRFDYFVVPKGAPNAEAAMRCIAYAEQAGPSLAFMKSIPYGMPNKDANKQLDPAYAKTMASSPENLSRGFPLNANFYAEDSGKGGSWLEYSTNVWNQWFAK